MWFRVAKVGSRTILNHLRSCNFSLDVDHAFKVHYPAKKYANYFKFAFVRNPWDRLVSGWMDKIVKKNYFKLSERKREEMLEFENFINYLKHSHRIRQDNHFCQQSTLIDLNNINFLGRLETFQDNMITVCKILGVENLHIESRNVTLNKKPYQEFYNAKLAETVAEIYKKDIQTFGYKF